MARDGRAAALHLLRRQLAGSELGRGGASSGHRTTGIARILLTGGGTGGHIYPALAIAEVLKERCAEPPALLFVGSHGGLEETLVPQAGVPIAFVASRPLPRRPSLDVLRTLLANVAGLAQAIRVLFRFRPQCVVATGGYVTFPVVLAARFLRAIGRLRGGIALLEPNAATGLTNRLLAPLVDEVWTEAPVRSSMLRLPSGAQARQTLGLREQALTIVVIGGSQGARRLNDAVTEAAERDLFPPEWQVLLVTGTGNAARVRAIALNRSVKVVEYLVDPAVAYAAADIVVARAGASTLAELAATGTPALLVPYPHATGDHQMKNAKAVESRGAARVVPDAVLDGSRLVAELRLCFEAQTAESMRAAASQDARIDLRERLFERISALLGRG